LNRLSTALEFSLEHPALRGHFPDHPIVPAVVLLDEVLHRLESASSGNDTPKTKRGWRLGSAKFYRSVRPGESLALELDTGADGSVRFRLSCSEALVAQGMLQPLAAMPSS